MATLKAKDSCFSWESALTKGIFITGTLKEWVVLTIKTVRSMTGTGKTIRRMDEEE